MNRTRTRQLLRQEHLAPQKKLGQNFLVHRHTAERIVELARIEPGQTVVEVGVGLGALTRPLANVAGRVIGIEADAGIVRMHGEQGDLPDNVELRHQDILKCDFGLLAGECGGRITFVANLPYSISSPFLFRLYEHADLMASAVIMLQKEVADRLQAKPGCKEYGVPTVLLGACSQVTNLMRVGPGEFHPRPKVDSAVVRLLFHPLPEQMRALDNFDANTLRRVVSAAFGKRRKTLVNALHGHGFCSDKKELGHRISQAGISPSIRAEQLRIEDFIRLANRLQQT
jgi:16S rRNA (adenine1518-N6/adenine1519-N6)-dimethyltransferase